VIEVFDHDFPTLAQGVVIPHGLYDVVQNIGYITLGTSHDTSEFAIDCIITWWKQYGCHAYPNATEILLLCDGGGSNSARTHLFKERLHYAAQVIGLPIRVAHYPPYTSKYNPIEHRLFPHVTRACRGVIFKSVDMVRALMERTTTRTGLHVHVTLLDKVYETGKKVANTFKVAMQIVFDTYLPQWNYTAMPDVGR
jgi:Rhodopirellula transposase DDE domain